MRYVQNVEQIYTHDAGQQKFRPIQRGRYQRYVTDEKWNTMRETGKVTRCWG